ncbi:MAG: type II toxin-antitoxin system PemK/MazF family toxin [Defluviitaleaceae bacterium]|nr:type II toxin-antitoxin system PemK/MazF family toxin [Defluviitaleaceae bacterium]
MVKPKQGDIIKLNLDPTKGHEQAGYRPVLVINNASSSKASNMMVICPITNTDRDSLLHVPLKGLVTTGFVMCDQIKAVDLKARDYKIIEAIDDDMLWEVIDIVCGIVEIED